MDIHIAVAGEPTTAYANMIRLLIYSLRQNGGALREAPVTVCLNEADLPAADRQAIERLGPVTCRVMPRQYGGEGFVNKFHALYAPLDEYDILLFLDCDTAIFRPLDDLVAGMDPDTPQFRGRAIGTPGAQKAGPLEALIQEHALSGDRTLADVADDRFPRGYPLFNSGVMAMTRPAVEHIRRDGLRLACELYARRAQTTMASVREMAMEVMRRVRGRLFPNATPDPYASWITEQLGIALSIIRNRVKYDVLPSRFNWVYPHRPDDGEEPALFHYMGGRHPQVDREHLFDGAWIEEARQGESPPRRTLARLAQAYAEEGRAAGVG